MKPEPIENPVTGRVHFPRVQGGYETIDDIRARASRVFPVHPSITFRKVQAAIRRDDGTGFCIACGKPRKYTEPDAEHYPCSAKRCALAHPAGTVYGAEQLLLLGAF